ncbi:DNA mismatch repair protein MutT [Frankia sp. AgKG'84/4]|nr:NUDIX domain-containing protein [Frankia sp. AgKG'84/4]
MVQPHQNALIDVRILLLRGEDVLMTQLSAGRFNGRWNVPGGHASPGEDVLSASVREVREEVGLGVQPEDLVFSSVSHHRPPTRSEKVTFTFSSRSFTGEPYAAEPDRAAVVRWMSLDDLPAALMPQAAVSLKLFRQEELFHTYGLGGVSGLEAGGD